MADSNTVSAHERYNSAATKYAIRLHEARTEARKRANVAQRPREERFPRGNRPGLGVALEYERMGNRPVSEDLQMRADSFRFELEHLGTTLGSVIHGIDLRKMDSPELVRFVRDALLERKVVFFRTGWRCSGADQPRGPIVLPEGLEVVLAHPGRPRRKAYATMP